MRVAVVVPVWGEPYVRALPEAIASVTAQRGVDVELVVVDNASEVPVAPHVPDGARVVRLPERVSTGAARNAGLAVVTSPLVAFLDADDLLLPDALARLARGLHDDLVGYGLGIVDGDSGGPHRAPRPFARVLARHPRVFALANAVWSLLPTQGAMLMRTEDARACRGYADRSQGEDWALAVALAFRGRIVLDAEPALVYRWRGDSPGRGGDPRVLLDNARCICERLRSDPAVPAWTRRLLPLVAAAQWTAVRVVRPVVRSLRPLRARARRAGPARARPPRRGRP